MYVCVCICKSTYVCARRVPPPARTDGQQEPPSSRGTPHLSKLPLALPSSLSILPSLPPSPPASAELLRGSSRGNVAPPPGFAAAFGEERSGGERHKREGRRESPSHAPLPQVYDGGPEEQLCSAATTRLLKTCCSAFWVKLMLIVSFHCAFLFFFFFLSLLSLLSEVPCAGVR